MGDKNGSSFIMYNKQSLKKSIKTGPYKLSKHHGDCLNGDSALVASEICKGLNGELYVAWGGPQGLSFQKSLDSGKTWLSEEKIICQLKKGWRVSKHNGVEIKGSPAMACVQGTTTTKGRIYVSWSDARNGEKNEDVFLVYSDDDGETWMDPIIVTYRPNHKSQFKPKMFTEQTTGYLYLVYFDQQNYAEGNFCDLYIAQSKNGGLKFDYYRLNEKPIPLNESSNPGFTLLETEYTDPKVKSGPEVKWYFTDENHLKETYSDFMNDSTMSLYTKNYVLEEPEIARSFKYSEKIKIDFYCPKEVFLSARLTKPLDSSFETLVLKEQLFRKGYNSLILNCDELRLHKGNYILTLYYNKRNTYVWITEE